MNKTHIKAAIALAALLVVDGLLVRSDPPCRRPSIFLNDIQKQYCDIRDSADEGAREGLYPADARRTGLNLRLANVGDEQILFFAGQHQDEETGKEVALLLGANGGYLDRHGNYVGATGNWSLPAARMIDGSAHDASAGTVALLLKRLPSMN